MKIAIVSAFMFDDSIGGVENHIRFISQTLERRGHVLRLFKPAWNNVRSECQQLDAQEDLDFRVVSLGDAPWWTGWHRTTRMPEYARGFVRKVEYNLRPNPLIRAVEEWNPDLVWQHDFSSSWRATRQLSKSFPVVLTNHTGEYLLLQRNRFTRPFLRKILRHYNAVIGPSTELTPIEHPSASTIFNGVDISHFKPLAMDERSRLRKHLLGRFCDRFTIFCPRRWAPTKGIIYLAKAMREMRPDIAQKIVVAFAGNDYSGYPGYVAEVKDQLQKAGVPFLCLGNLGIYKIREWYQLVDLVVIPSLMEAVSLAALEAMACGTPVLATAVGGMPELIKSGVNGYLVPEANPTALANAIEQIIPDERTRFIARQGYELVRTSYSWEAIGKEVEGVLLKSAGRAVMAVTGR